MALNKKFVALIDVMTAAEDTQFSEALTKKGLGYWHWIDGGWLIVESPGGSQTAGSIRAMAHAAAPSKNCLVFEVPSISTWAGMGPAAKAEQEKMFGWIRENWER